MQTHLIQILILAILLSDMTVKTNAYWVFYPENMPKQGILPPKMKNPH